MNIEINNSKFDNQKEALTLILPGALDKAEFNAYQSLEKATTSLKGYGAFILDMYGLPGIRPIENPETSSNEYDCDWHPSYYLRAINKAARAAKREGYERVNLVGFSYGGQMALMYAIVAEPFGLEPIDKIVSMMPPNHWHWEEYNASIDFDWMRRMYEREGLVNILATHTEIRSASRADIDPASPPKDTELVHITRRAISNHLMPFNHLIPGSELPIGLVGLEESRLLEKVKIPSLLISGKYDTLTPEMPERVHAMYEQLPKSIGHEFVELPVTHDYRDNPDELNLVNNTVTDYLVIEN